MKKCYVIRLSKFLRQYVAAWKKSRLGNIDVGVFIEWALSIAIEDFERKAGGIGMYDATYADYMHFIQCYYYRELDNEPFDKDTQNGWNRIVTFGNALRTCLDTDFLNRQINPNLDLYRVNAYNERNGMMILTVLEEE